MNDTIKNDDLFGFGEFIKHPFQPGGSALNWILFVGFMLVVLWFWQWVLIKLSRGMAAVTE